jgi:hypothetical protein
MPRPWATSWNMVLAKNASKVTCPLVFGDQRTGDGHHDLVELGPHGVLELQTARALGELDLLVVGQVDGDRLGAGVGVAGVVDHVVGVEIGVGARGLLLVGGPAPASPLQLRAAGGEALQAGAPLHVLDEHEALVRGLVAVALVLVGLDRPDDHVDRVVLHVHPGHVAGLVLVGAQGFGAEREVALESGLGGHTRRGGQLGSAAVLVRGIGDVVRDRREAAVPARRTSV